MTEINLREFEFDEGLLENVQLFDEVLTELGEPPLFENQNFRVWDSPEITTRYLVMETTNKRENTLSILIWFEGEDLRIDIDQINETFDWSKKQIKENKSFVIQLIRNLFTGYILINERRSSKFIQIFDRNGNFTNCQSRNNLFHMITGRFLFRFSDYRKLYLPLFKKK